jgi:hypothetical protein
MEGNMTITLDNVTAENAAGLTTVELIDITYDHMTRVQRKTMHHFTPNEVLLEAYDEHAPFTFRDINPRMLALDAELWKRFQSLRPRLTSSEKSRLTRWVKELNFTGLISLTKDPSSRFYHEPFEKTMALADTVLALLLEGESKQNFEKVLLRYAEKHAKWNKDVDAWRAKNGLRAVATADK